MIKVMDEWHFEQRARLTSYTYIICELCCVRGFRIFEANTNFEEGIINHAVRQKIEEQVLRRWKN